MDVCLNIFIDVETDLTDVLARAVMRHCGHDYHIAHCIEGVSFYSKYFGYQRILSRSRFVTMVESLEFLEGS
jgi:hypothetical protein